MERYARAVLFSIVAIFLSMSQALAAEPLLWFPLADYQAVSCDFYCYTNHNGVDFALPEGTPLYAPVSGDVVASKNDVNGQICTGPDFGNYIKIRTGNYDVILGHMKYGTVNTHGGHVEAGDFVGYSSNTGYTFSGGVCGQGGGYHLHLELRYNSTPVDPELYWASTPPRQADGSPGSSIEDLISAAATTNFSTYNKHNKRKNSATGAKESPGICINSSSNSLHWWGYSSGQTPSQSSTCRDCRTGNYEYTTLYTQDYTGSCTGAVVYDDWGGANRAYVVQAQQWSGWLQTNGPQGSSSHNPQYCGNPITNVYGKGHKWVQDFQDCRVTYHPDDTNTGANPVDVLDYPSGFAPGEFTSGGWDDVVSYAIARKYEKYGASKHFGYPTGGVCANGDRYLQTFSGTNAAGYQRVVYYDWSEGSATVTNSSQLTCSYSASSITDDALDVDTSAADDDDLDNDGDSVADGDCDDTDANINPDSWEWYDGVDNDCDGVIDNNSVSLSGVELDFEDFLTETGLDHLDGEHFDEATSGTLIPSGSDFGRFILSLNQGDGMQYSWGNYACIMANSHDQTQLTLTFDHTFSTLGLVTYSLEQPMTACGYSGPYATGDLLECYDLTLDSATDTFQGLWFSDAAQSVQLQSTVTNDNICFQAIDYEPDDDNDGVGVTLDNNEWVIDSWTGPEDQYLFIDSDHDGVQDPCIRRLDMILCDEDLDGTSDSAFAYGDGVSATYFSTGDGVAVVFGYGTFYLDEDADGATDRTYNFGVSSDAGHYFGNGGALAIQRSTRYFVVDNNAAGGEEWYYPFGWGLSTQHYYLADFNGDGEIDLTFRQGNLFTVDQTHEGGDDFYFTYGYGDSDDYYFADLTGDDKDELIVRRGSTFYVLNNTSIPRTCSTCSNSASWSFSYGNGL